MQRIAVAVVQTAPPLDPSLPADAWSAATSVVLSWDVQNRRPASELSKAFITTEGRNIYVRFEVQQREALLAQQHTNDVGDGTDDEVWVDLWPNGNRGFSYQFAATSNGTHFQYSSENTAYAPTWWSYGKAYAGGFTVTMKISLAVMRGASASGWKAQFTGINQSDQIAQTGGPLRGAPVPDRRLCPLARSAKGRES